MKNQISRYYCKNCGNVQSINKENKCRICGFKTEEINSTLKISNKLIKYRLLIIFGFIFFISPFISFLIPGFYTTFILCWVPFIMFFLSLIMLPLGYYLFKKTSKKISSNIRDIGYKKYGNPKSFNSDEKNVQLKTSMEQSDKNQTSEEKYDSLKEKLKIVNDKIRTLTDKLIKDTISGDAYKTAIDNLEKEKKEIEEELWKLRNILFKDDYEKPF